VFVVVVCLGCLVRRQRRQKGDCVLKFTENTIELFRWLEWWAVCALRKLRDSIVSDDPWLAAMDMHLDMKAGKKFHPARIEWIESQLGTA
jgi:hypothetical protein